MAVNIVGTSVEWGIPSDLKTVADSIVTGIVQSATVETDGNVTEIQDEDGDHVTRIDHGEKNTVTLSSIVTAVSPVLPAKGTEVTFAAAINGVALNTGEAYIESASISHEGTSTTTVDFTITHYPDMTTPP